MRLDDDVEALVSHVEHMYMRNVQLQQRCHQLVEALGHALPQLVGEARLKARAALTDAVSSR